MKRLLFLLLPFAALSAPAATIDVVASSRGWLTSSFSGAASATANFIAGSVDGVENRDFFRFDLPAFTGSLTSATLLFSGLPADHYNSDNIDPLSGIGDTVHFEAHALSGPISGASFAAIDSGHNYGGVDLASAVSQLSITLDGVALGNIAPSSAFYVGGELFGPVDPRSGLRTPLANFLEEYIFASTNNAGTVTLELQTDAGGGSNTPEPESFLMLAGGLFALAMTFRRKP